MTLLTYPKFQAPDINGVNLAGGLVYFYATGTTTPKDTYSDEAKSVVNTNPVVLDSRGEADIYLDGEYKIVLKTADDVEIWTVDSYTGFALLHYPPLPGEIGVTNYEYPYWDIKRWGPTGDGVSDDTTKILSAITSCQTTGYNLNFDKAHTYLVSRQGTYTLAFDSSTIGYVFQITSPININGNNALFKEDNSTSSLAANIFNYYNTSDSYIRNIKAQSTTAITTKASYQGAAVVIDQCDNVHASAIDTTNMIGGALIFQSNDCDINRSISKIVAGQVSGSHFAIYGGRNCELYRVKSYEGSQDGDIGLFGGSGRDNKITHCRCNNHTFLDASKAITSTTAQGIYVDSGQDNATIDTNYVYGHYYGIDVKTDVQNTTVKGNTVEKCKYQIVARRGEGDLPLISVSIVGNTLKPYGGNGHTGTIISGYDTCGIWLQDAWGAQIHSNKFVMEYTATSTTEKWIGIYANQSATIDQAKQAPISIVGNYFNYECRLSTEYVYNQGYGIYITGVSAVNPTLGVNIAGNTFNLPYKNDNDGAIWLKYLQNVDITSNTFEANQGAYVITFDNCYDIGISSNGFGANSGVVNGSNSNGIVFDGNRIAQTDDAATIPTVDLTTCTIVGITSNTMRSTSVNDEFFLQTTTSDKINLSGNTVSLTNKSIEDSVRTAAYKWTASASGTNEYYLEIAAGGDPSINQTLRLMVNDMLFTKSTVGSLAVGEWDWGDNDTLGYSTIYVRLHDGADPDSKEVGFIKAINANTWYSMDSSATTVNITDNLID